MSYTKTDVDRFAEKISKCTSMTALLTAMSSWQSFADNNGITADDRAPVEQAYLKAEALLIGGVKPTLW